MDYLDDDYDSCSNNDTTPNNNINNFGYNCSNTVWEGYFGNVICEIYFVDNILYCANIPN